MVDESPALVWEDGAGVSSEGGSGDRWRKAFAWVTSGPLNTVPRPKCDKYINRENKY